MAEVVADRLLGGEGTFPGADLSTKLKLLGVDVASFGDAFAAGRRAASRSSRRPGGRRLQEARAVGRRQDAARRHPRRRRQRLRRAAADGRPRAAAATRRHTSCPRAAAPAPAGDLPDDAAVCSCNNVTAGTIRCAVTDGGCTDVAGVKACTKAGTSCGSCVPLVKKLVATELARSGVDGQQRAVRALRPLAGRSSSTPCACQGLTTFSAVIDAPRQRARLRHLQARDRRRSCASLGTGTSSRASRRRCRTPTTT